MGSKSGNVLFSLAMVLVASRAGAEAPYALPPLGGGTSQAACVPPTGDAAEDQVRRIAEALVRVAPARAELSNRDLQARALARARARAEIIALLDRVCRRGDAEDSLNRVGRRHPEWSPAELKRNTVVTAYTHNCFRQINSALRAGRPPTAEMRAALRLLDEALAKQAPFRGEVYRGVDLPEHVLENYRVGAVVTEPAYTSTSERRASAFQDRCQNLVIRSKTGRRVSGLAFNEYEKEVLFAPGTKFKVVSRTTRPGRCRPMMAGEDETAFAEIELEETE